tara:strand:+ start:1206 stop:2165 length:960 start_codon:yes stop_codon:yes gene_type:complete
MNHRPLVSICIPCHNGGPFVRQAVQSALDQTWQDIEIIVVNDASTDESASVLASFDDSRLTVIDEKCGSAPRTRNRALEQAEGEYIKFFDADDVISPGLIERQIEKLKGRQDAIASSEWGRFYDDNLSTYRANPEPVWQDMEASDWLVKSWEKARPMCQPGMFLIPRTLIQKSGPWDTKLAEHSPCDDFEFFARVISNANEVLFTPGETLYYRSEIEGSLSKQTSKKAVEAAYHSILQGTNALLSRRNDAESRQSCASVLQNFIYTYYPNFPDLLKRMEARVAELGGTNLRAGGPPRFQQVQKFLGWKLARRIQRLFGH